MKDDKDEMSLELKKDPEIINLNNKKFNINDIKNIKRIKYYYDGKYYYEYYDDEKYNYEYYDDEKYNYEYYDDDPLYGLKEMPEEKDEYVYQPYTDDYSDNEKYAYMIGKFVTISFGIGLLITGIILGIIHIIYQFKH